MSLTRQNRGYQNIDEKIMSMKAVRTIHRICKEKGLSLSVAESCTGGLISHCLTAMPGASSFFKAGVVAYSAEAKKSLLGIPQSVLTAHGSVSEETARQMAERVRKCAETDVAVSTTGNIGPDALENKQVGLVYVAVSVKGKITVKKLMLNGSRGQIKKNAVIEAFALLAEKLADA